MRSSETPAILLGVCSFLLGTSASWYWKRQIWLILCCTFCGNELMMDNGSPVGLCVSQERKWLMEMADPFLVSQMVPEASPFLEFVFLTSYKIITGKSLVTLFCSYFWVMFHKTFWRTFSFMPKKMCVCGIWVEEGSIFHLFLQVYTNRSFDTQLSDFWKQFLLTGQGNNEMFNYGNQISNSFALISWKEFETYFFL